MSMQQASRLTTMSLQPKVTSVGLGRSVRLLTIVLLFVLTGCAAPYGLSYTPLLHTDDSRLIKGDELQHEWVDDMLAESLEMHANGYAMVGYSYMCGAHITKVAPTAAKNWGRKLDASKVLQYVNGCIYLATYWREIRGFSLGAYYDDAPEQAQRAFGMDAGVLIQNVVSNTPAARANLQPGDLVLAIDDEIIPNAAWLDAVLADQQGQEIILTVWPSLGMEPLNLAIDLSDGSDTRLASRVAAE